MGSPGNSMSKDEIIRSAVIEIEKKIPELRSAVNNKMLRDAFSDVYEKGRGDRLIEILRANKGRNLVILDTFPDEFDRKLLEF